MKELTTMQQIAKLLKELNGTQLSTIIEYASELRWKMQKEERSKLEDLDL